MWQPLANCEKHKRFFSLPILIKSVDTNVLPKENFFTYQRFLLPLIAILDAANPIPYFQFLHVIYYVIFPSVLWSP